MSKKTPAPPFRGFLVCNKHTRVVGNFPDGNAALTLVTSRLRYIAGRQWGTRCYKNMDLLFKGEMATR
jgi:hypothetical protein